jgi:hypothetical protein
MVEATSKKQIQITPNAGKKMVWAQGISAANGDILTVSDLTVVEYCIGVATDGTAANYSITGSSSIITLLNGGTKTWNFLCVGY